MLRRNTKSKRNSWLLVPISVVSLMLSIMVLPSATADSDYASGSTSVSAGGSVTISELTNCGRSCDGSWEITGNWPYSISGSGKTVTLTVPAQLGEAPTSYTVVIAGYKRDHTPTNPHEYVTTWTVSVSDPNWPYATPITPAQTDLTLVLSCDANGGSVSPTQVSYTSSGPAVGCSTPTRPGHTFAGWFTAPTGGTAFNFPIRLTANTTAYARWTPINLTLNCDATGGSVTPTVVTATDSNTNVSCNTPSRSGYTFNGWFTAATGGSAFAFPIKLTTNTTAYARWTAIPVINSGEVQGTVYFALLSYDLDKAAQKKIKKAVSEIPDNATNIKVTITGWAQISQTLKVCDSNSISKNRAKKVRDYLADLGVDGEVEITANGCEKDSAKSRRATFQISYDY